MVPILTTVIAAAGHIYVVTTVYKTEALIITMTVGEKTNEVALDEMQPIAFQMERREVRKNGTVGNVYRERISRGLSFAHKGLTRSPFRSVCTSLLPSTEKP